MAYLEEKRYVHCDLAARNILVGESDVVKIADFGLAKILQNDRLMVDRESQFPIKWTAPEAATKKEYTTKSDVWSFGVLLYELITHGSNPYPGMSNNEALQSVLNGYRMPRVMILKSQLKFEYCFLYVSRMIIMNFIIKSCYLAGKIIPIIVQLLKHFICVLMNL